MVKKLYLSSKSRIYHDEPMARHTTIGIGGIARMYVTVGSYTDLVRTLKYAAYIKTRVIMIGYGANMLISSEYVDVIFLRLQYLELKVRRTHIYATSATSLSALLNTCAQKGLSGLEHLVGIPSTVGGAVCGNVGTPHQSISSAVESVLVLDNYRKKWLSVQQCHFAYRDSTFRKSSYIILGVRLALAKSTPQEISDTMKQAMDKKRLTQPLSEKSAGSIFRRLGDFTPAKVIDQLGYKGRSVGGAMVSDMHAGFIINKGSATSKDVLTLINILQDAIAQHYHLLVQTEIIYIE